MWPTIDSIRRLINWPQSCVSLLVLGGLLVAFGVATLVMNLDGADDGGDDRGDHRAE